MNYKYYDEAGKLIEMFDQGYSVEELYSRVSDEIYDIIERDYCHRLRSKDYDSIDDIVNTIKHNADDPAIIEEARDKLTLILNKSHISFLARFLRYIYQRDGKALKADMAKLLFTKSYVNLYNEPKVKLSDRFGILRLIWIMVSIYFNDDIESLMIWFAERDDKYL